jgi:hypothetical protein
LLAIRSIDSRVNGCLTTALNSRAANGAAWACATFLWRVREFAPAASASPLASVAFSNEANRSAQAQFLCFVVYGEVTLSFKSVALQATVKRMALESRGACPALCLWRPMSFTVAVRRDSVIDDRLAQFASASRDRMLLPLAASFSGGAGALSAANTAS